MSADGRIYIAEAAEELGRAEHTIRQWLGRADFPDALKPSREGGRNKIFWTLDQLRGLHDYADEREAQRGTWGRGSAASA